MTAAAVEPLPTVTRSVHVGGSLPGRRDHGCVSCGARDGVRELVLGVSGWPFSAHLCPACLAVVLDDLS